MTRQEHNREASSQATCNWVEVRNKAAIAAMQSILTSDAFRNAIIDAATNIGELPEKEITATSIRFADELIKLLKGE